MTAEDWIKRYKSIGIVEMINEIEKYAYNQGAKDALKLASERATTRPSRVSAFRSYVDKESILNLDKELMR